VLQKFSSSFFALHIVLAVERNRCFL
jgi:hypothetical protein